MDNLITYDTSNPISIEKYAQQLIGKTFQDVLDNAYIYSTSISEDISYGDKQRKGGLGILLEEVFFGYKANSNQNADFEEAGVELKVSPFQVLKNGNLSAGERLVLTMISYKDPIEDNFYQSHAWLKSKLILLVYYHRDKSLENNLLYKIHYAKLFTPPKEDLLIIENDYKIITSKLKQGLAHEISESDTMYLGACTKGSTAIKSTQPQYYTPHIPARKRAFCFKTSYMSYILNNYIAPNKSTYEPIIKDIAILRNSSFENIITDKINSYKSHTDEYLCSIFNRPYNNNKAQWSDLCYRMLDIKSNNAEEFKKANVTVKAIRIEKNNSIKENMSFPSFNFKELAQEDWEDSQLYNYFNETKFLFVIFKKNTKGTYTLGGCQFWNMPQNDIEGDLKSTWISVKKTLISGVKLEKVPYNNSNGYIFKNNLPKISGNRIAHIRPHAQTSAYKIDGVIYGDLKNANELPNGNWMTTQSFWINNSYIISQIDSNLLNFISTF